MSEFSEVVILFSGCSCLIKSVLQSWICTLELYTVFGSCHLIPKLLDISGFVSYFSGCLKKYMGQSFHTFFLLLSSKIIKKQNTQVLLTIFALSSEFFRGKKKNAHV